MIDADDIEVAGVADPVSARLEKTRRKILQGACMEFRELWYPSDDDVSMMRVPRLALDVEGFLLEAKADFFGILFAALLRFLSSESTMIAVLLYTCVSSIRTVFVGKCIGILVMASSSCSSAVAATAAAIVMVGSTLG